MDIKNFQESLDRYKKLFPKKCEHKSDIWILRYRNLITDAQAEELKKNKKESTAKFQKQLAKKKSSTNFIFIPRTKAYLVS